MNENKVALTSYQITFISRCTDITYSTELENIIQSSNYDIIDYLKLFPSLSDTVKLNKICYEVYTQPPGEIISKLGDFRESIANDLEIKFVWCAILNKNEKADIYTLVYNNSITEILTLIKRSTNLKAFL